MSRPEYVTCVARDMLQRVAWCQRSIAMEFSFVDANHAASAQEKGDRLTVCPDCAKQLCFWLTHNAGDQGFEKPPGIIRVHQVRYSVEFDLDDLTPPA